MGLKTLEKPTELTFTVKSAESTVVGYDATNEIELRAMILILEQDYEVTPATQNVTFVQTEDMTQAGIAVQPYGAFIFNEKAPTILTDSDINPVIQFSDGTRYTCDANIFGLVDEIGGQIYFEPMGNDDDDTGPFT